CRKSDIRSKRCQARPDGSCSISSHTELYMAISSIGVGSGLPLDALLSDLRKAESRPLSLLESRAASTHKKLGAYDTIKGAVQSLRSAAQALADPATFGALAVNSQSE